jgi:hypothetical protein
MTEQQDQPLIEGKIAASFSHVQVLINRGQANGVEVGMIFAVMEEGKRTNVTDPDTNEVIGVIDPERCRIRVVSVQSRLAVCELIVDSPIERLSVPSRDPRVHSTFAIPGLSRGDRVQEVRVVSTKN